LEETQLPECRNGFAAESIALARFGDIYIYVWRERMLLYYFLYDHTHNSALLNKRYH